MLSGPEDKTMTKEKMLEKVGTSKEEEEKKEKAKKDEEFKEKEKKKNLGLRSVH